MDIYKYMDQIWEIYVRKNKIRKHLQNNKIILIFQKKKFVED